MSDQLTDILKNYLFVEDPSLRDLMLETVSLCERPMDLKTAIARLDAKRNKFSSSVDFLEKVPYCYLFLSYAFFQGDDLAQAVKSANIAIDGFDQLNHVWNRSITRWICALYYVDGGDSDEAERYFKAAARLMTQEIQDRKRRSWYKQAEACETIYKRLLAQAHLLKQSRRADRLAIQFGDNEIGLFQILLNLVGGDNAAAEHLIEFECARNPTAGRIEHIRRAIEGWMKDNR